MSKQENPIINDELIDKFDSLLLRISGKLSPKTIAGDSILIGNKNNCFLVVKGEYNKYERLSSVEAILFKLEAGKDETLTFQPSLYGSMNRLDSGLARPGADILNYDDKDMEITNKLLSSYLDK